MWFEVRELAIFGLSHKIKFYRGDFDCSKKYIKVLHTCNQTPSTNLILRLVCLNSILPLSFISYLYWEPRGVHEMRILYSSIFDSYLTYKCNDMSSNFTESKCWHFFNEWRHSLSIKPPFNFRRKQKKQNLKLKSKSNLLEKNPSIFNQ